MIFLYVAGSGAVSIRHRGGCPPPHFYEWLQTGGTVSRRTADKKVTKLYITKAVTKTYF